MGRLEFTLKALNDWSRLRPDTDLAHFAVIQRLIWIGRLAEELLERGALESGFRRRGDYEVLALLRRSEPLVLTPVEIADQLLTSQSGMTGKLDRLETQGLIRRMPDPEDRRTIKVILTDSGRSQIESAFDSSLVRYESITASLTRTEEETLHMLLGKVLKRLDELS